MAFIIHVNDEENEIEGMFSEDGTLLGSWCLNDAHWRNEYFDGFIQALGYEITGADEDLAENLISKLRERFGIN